MRSSIVRTVVAPLTLAAAALVVGRAEANPPHASCQTDAPHHTATLGAGKDSVSLTSTHQYWDNACGCYIAQIDVPSTSTPADSKLTPKFAFGPLPGNLYPGVSQADCKWHERIYVYKKNASGAFAQIPGGEFEQHGDWVFGIEPFSQPNAPKKHYCSVAGPGGTLGGQLSPPATGTDVYRVLRSYEGPSKFRAVTVTATHTPPPQPPPH